MVIINSTISGSLTATNPGSLTVCGSTVGKNLNVSGATGFVLLGDPGDDACAGNTFKGTVTLSSNASGVELARNQISNNTYVNGTSGTGLFPEDSRAEIEGNTITGNLSCTGNSPPPSHDTQPNTVSGTRSGQCGAAGF